MQYHRSNSEKSSCPNCRGDVNSDQLGSTTVDQMATFVERAKMSQGAEREVYVNLTLRQIDATFNFHSPEDHLDSKDRLQLNTIVAKTTILRELNMHREVIDTVDNYMELCATTEGVKVDNILYARMSKARAHIGLEQWETALGMYQILNEDCKERHQQYCCAIAAGISRAQYELQNYHEASLEGARAAYRHNRYHARVHKYIALSQMKLGDIAEAKKTITRGLLYEEQWNEENRKENEEVLRMILAKEETQNTKSKSSTKKKGKKNSKGKK